MDVYHIAYAESKNLDYFITVDKQLINACKRANLELKVVNPMEFIMEVIQMAVTVKDLERIRQEGLKALREKLGPIGMIKSILYIVIMII